MLTVTNASGGFVQIKALRQCIADKNVRAMQLDVTLERAPMSGSWFLTDRKGKPIVDKLGRTAFGTDRAIKLLKERVKRKG